MVTVLTPATTFTVGEDCNQNIGWVNSRVGFKQKKLPKREAIPKLMAEPTGLEPATSDVTGRRSNQLNYDSAKNSHALRLGRHGGTRTPNLFLVREAVYH